MATTQAAAPESTLQDLAKRHLWLHFSRMGAYAEADIPIIVKGDGCYVWDEHGNKYLDGLSALFCVNIGHGRVEVAQAGADQAKELGFFTTWSYAHPRAIELAAKLAELAPGDLNRVFFTSGGSESVETALKLARQYHKLTGHPNKHKVIAITGTAANIAGIAGGIIVFGDPMPGTVLGIVLQAFAFVLVITASALTPAPVRSARAAATAAA